MGQSFRGYAVDQSKRALDLKDIPMLLQIISNGTIEVYNRTQRDYI